MVASSGSKKSVFIEVSGPDPKKVKANGTPNSSTRDGRTTLSSSGFVLSNNDEEKVITTLSAFYSFFDQEYKADLISKRKQLQARPLFLPLTTVKVNNTVISPDLISIVKLDDSIDAALRLLLNTPTAVNGSWLLGYNSSLSIETQIVISSHIVVIPYNNTTHGSSMSIPHIVDTKTTTIVQHDLQSNSTEMGSPGDKITIIGCPFGGLVSTKFHDFHIQGIVSSYLLRNTISLLDVKCLPGMEGGPLYASQHTSIPPTQASISGMFSLPLRAQSSPFVLNGSSNDHNSTISAEFGVSIPIHVITKAAFPSSFSFQSRARGLLRNSNNNPTYYTNNIGALSVEAAAVVAIESSPYSWATGVCVTPSGHVLTNAHALRNHLDTSSSTTSSSDLVYVHVPQREGGMISPRMKRCQARILHKFQPPIDLAVLQILRDNCPSETENQDVKNIKNKEYMPLTKNYDFTTLTTAADSLPLHQICIVGFPLWRPFPSLVTQGPLITSGNISLIIDSGACICTSADVHSGSSGGALVDCRSETGGLLGLVTSNTKKGSHVYPHLNYCLGLSVLEPLVRMLLRPTTSMHAGHQQGCASDWEEVERIWRMNGSINAWNSMRSMSTALEKSGKEDVFSTFMKRLLPPGTRSGSGPSKL